MKDNEASITFAKNNDGSTVVHVQPNGMNDAELIGHMQILIQTKLAQSVAGFMEYQKKLKKGKTKQTGRKMIPENTPKIVCLCGSTRFHREFQKANYEETMKGNIVLSVGVFLHTTEEVHGEKIGITEEQKIKLDELHKRKIDIADEILVLNVNGYIGESTSSEIDYAQKRAKVVRYLQEIEVRV